MAGDRELHAPAASVLADERGVRLFDLVDVSLPNSGGGFAPSEVLSGHGDGVIQGRRAGERANTLGRNNKFPPVLSLYNSFHFRSAHPPYPNTNLAKSVNIRRRAWSQQTRSYVDIHLGCSWNRRLARSERRSGVIRVPNDRHLRASDLVNGYSTAHQQPPWPSAGS